MEGNHQCRYDRVAFLLPTSRWRCCREMEVWGFSGPVFCSVLLCLKCSHCGPKSPSGKTKEMYLLSSKLNIHNFNAAKQKRTNYFKFSDVSLYKGKQSFLTFWVDVFYFVFLEQRSETCDSLTLEPKYFLKYS